MSHSHESQYLVTPKMGTCVVFEHDKWHAGLRVINNCKYILRTEVIFTRCDREYHPDTFRYMVDPKFRMAKQYYELHKVHEEEGNKEKFIEW